MRYLVTVKPGPMPPPIEQLRQAKAWIQGRLDDGTFEVVYAFPEGGGLSIGSYDSIEQLMEQLLEYPLSAFVEYDVQPLTEVDAAFERVIPYMEKLTGQGVS